MNKKTITYVFVTILLISSFSVSAITVSQNPTLPTELSDYDQNHPMSINDELSSIQELQSRHIDKNTPFLQTVTGDVNGLIWQIDESIVQGYIQGLVNYGPRVTGSSACDNAGNYIYGEFSSMGLDVRKQSWSGGGYQGFNVEATHYGSDPHSDEVYIVCGHYDSVPGSPGADDNAAGTAAVLSAAEVMSDFSFRHTVKFVAFSGEEQGLYGSNYYVEEIYNNGENVVAALNADMIGYAETDYDKSRVKVYTDSASQWIVDFTDTVSQTYYDLIDLEIINAGYASNSDHYRFWQRGYNAVMYHEYHFNPYYHSADDTMDKMDFDYDARITRLITATVAEMAELQQGGGGGGGGGNNLPPVVRINSPYDGEIVNGSIDIKGTAFDFETDIDYVFLQIDDEPWIEAEMEKIDDGMVEWSSPLNTQQYTEGSHLISAVCLDEGSKQSAVDYVEFIVQNEEEPEEKIADLHCEGQLTWTNVSPSGVVTGEFTIENIGDAGSLLNWSIARYPDWGTWSFSQDEGSKLKPEDGIVTISVTVESPDEEEQTFGGELKIINQDNSSDFEIVQISLSTPKQRFVFLDELIEMIKEQPFHSIIDWLSELLFT